MKTVTDVQYQSFYKCPQCKLAWDSVWDSACGDECPECGIRDITPYASRLILTPEQFVARVVGNVKQKTWLNETVQVNGEPVGIKAYGLWVQKLTCKGLSDGAEFHTQKALKQWLLSALQWGAQ